MQFAVGFFAYSWKHPPPPQQNIRLSLYNDVEVKMLHLGNLSFNATEDEISSGLLELEDWKLFYGCQNHKLIDVDIVEV